MAIKQRQGTVITITGRSGGGVPPGQATASFAQAAVNIGGGTPVNINHNLNSTFVDVSVIRNSTNSIILQNTTVVDADNITITKNGNTIAVDVVVIAKV